MSAKVKLISFISAFVLVLGIMIIGVLSAEQVQVNIGGSVSFNATNVYAKVSGNISGAETGNKTFSTLTYSAEETTGDESDWTNLALEFTEAPDPIIITITVENLSTQRTLTVNLENTLQGEGLDIAVTRDSGSYTSAANVELPVSTGDGSSTTTFTLSLTVANPDQSLTDVSFGYILNLFDENYTPPPTPASSFTFSYSDASHTASITKFVGSETEVIIPSTVENNGITYTVTSIGTSAFYNCRSLTLITIPSTVTSIGSSAFYNCSSLTSISIPDSVTSIGESAFSSCHSLTSINIPYGVTSIDMHTFRHCSSLTSITIPDSVTSIDYRAFQNCAGLTSIIIPKGVTSIGQQAFLACSSLTSITIPSSVTSIDMEAFGRCYALAEVYNYSPSITVKLGETSSSNNGYLGQYAKVVYNASDLTGVKPEPRITVVDNVQYYDYGDDFIALAPAVARRTLTEVTLDNRTTEINQYAFSGCSSLTRITINATTPPTLGYNVFSSNVTNIYVPAESVDPYKSASGWSSYTNIISAIV